ncbi:glycoside hydrolase family 43 [Aspergillus nomiae NRRL 13137]|uniref:Glycoside hydrolase family 43 n=1 Tax=Aspergillus nomiae NRRL (strain ATCC 15546 / NRRL 13137 / CBS 260.88 / M93) TaxID=1509407 RepID=A0A0L1J5F0_ASPN3|nr:glycoside hydrolase family 43 [Aspergillus nomiae NRRL 13137]KNG86653.1 glycoside hydrolase family 43 [Aspergillus nomiae NRRL 13137]
MAVGRFASTLLALAACANAKWIVPGARCMIPMATFSMLMPEDFALIGRLASSTGSGSTKSRVKLKVVGSLSIALTTLQLGSRTGSLSVKPIENHTYISPHNRIQRPKVIYSEETGQYHMWWHADDDKYSWLLQGLATADNIAGPYTFVDATSPLAVEEVTYRFPKYDFEAPTILQTENSYYALMSHKTGYRPNNVVAFRADKLEGPWSQPFFVSPAYTRTFSTQSGFSWRIQGTKKTTHLYMADQWDMNSLWESRNVWLPIEIDDREGSLKVVWHDVYDMNVKTGEWKPIEGETYISKHAKTAGDAYLQEAIFASGNRIATGIYGNDSTITFTVRGQGQDQWVSFYHQSKLLPPLFPKLTPHSLTNSSNIDDMGFGDQPMGQPDRINSTWQLRRISSVVVNGDTENVHTLYQKDTHKGIILSTPLLLSLNKGENTITVGGLWNGFDFKGADLDRAVVYPPEGAKKRWFW